MLIQSQTSIFKKEDAINLQHGQLQMAAGVIDLTMHNGHIQVQKAIQLWIPQIHITVLLVMNAMLVMLAATVKQ